MKKLFVSLALLFLNCTRFICCFRTPDSRENTYIRDDKNRICIYHGMNLCNYSKGAPDFLPWHTEEDYARLQEWGFNVVRFLVFWEAIEPQKGVYNEAYLDSVVSKIQMLNKYGVDVFIDVHQDLYCRKFTGNGFPLWTLDGVNLPEFHEQKPWNLNYTQPAVIKSYEHFWRSIELRDRYISMLKVLAHKVEPLPNVIGIDVMNEPFPGINLNFERDKLSPFYENILRAWKDDDLKVRIFFEPWMLTNGVIKTGLTFKDSAGVYVPHYYDPFCHEGIEYTAQNKKLMRKTLLVKLFEAQKFFNPMLLGETGISKTVPGYLRYIRDLMELSDEFAFSWTWYSYDMTIYSGFGIVGPDRKEEENLTELVRPYPQRVAGEYPSYSFKDSIFVLEFVATQKENPTIVFIPKDLSVEIVSATGTFEIEDSKWCYRAVHLGPQKLVLKLKKESL